MMADTSPFLLPLLPASGCSTRSLGEKEVVQRSLVLFCYFSVLISCISLVLMLPARGLHSLSENANLSPRTSSIPTLSEKKRHT